MKSFDTIITKNYLVFNTSTVKAVNVLIKLIAFSSDHYDFIDYKGNPLGRLRFSGENAFILYSFKSMLPRERKEIVSQIYLKRKMRADIIDAFDMDISDIPYKMRKKALNTAYIYASRRVKKVVDRILRKTRNLREIEWEIINFLQRNIKCSRDLDSDPETIFYRNYGGVRDIVFAFNTINMLMGIPARTISGLVIDNNVLKRYFWSEVFTRKGWIPIDPCKGVFLDPNDLSWIPIKVELHRSVKDIETRYKLVKRMIKKAIDVFLNKIEIVVKMNSEVYSSQLEPISPG